MSTTPALTRGRGANGRGSDEPAAVGVRFDGGTVGEPDGARDREREAVPVLQEALALVAELRDPVETLRAQGVLLATLHPGQLDDAAAEIRRLLQQIGSRPARARTITQGLLPAGGDGDYIIVDDAGGRGGVTWADDKKGPECAAAAESPDGSELGEPAPAAAENPPVKMRSSTVKDDSINLNRRSSWLELAAGLRRPILVLLVAMPVGVVFATQRLRWPVPFAFYWVVQTALTVGYGDEPECVNDGGCRSITDGDGDMLFVIVLAVFLVAPVTALLSEYLDYLLTHDRKAKAAMQLAYLKSYKEVYEDAKARCSGGQGDPEVIDTITADTVSARTAVESHVHSHSHDRRGTASPIELADMSAPVRRSFIVGEMKRGKSVRSQRRPSFFNSTTSPPRRSGSHDTLELDGTDRSDDEEEMLVVTLWNRYPITFNVVQWLIIAAVGVTFFMGHYSHRFVLALYWVVITGLAVGYGDTSPAEETGFWFTTFFMIFIVTASYALLGKVAAMFRPEGSVAAALQKTFDIETMKAIDRNNDGEVEKHEYLQAVLVMLDRIDFETCNLILEHYEDLTNGDAALNLDAWTKGESRNLGASLSFRSKIGEGSRAVKAKQRAQRALSHTSRGKMSVEGTRAAATAGRTAHKSSNTSRLRSALSI